MAKFCGNCGTPATDDAYACGNCGAPFAMEPIAAPAAPVAAPAAPKKDIFESIPGYNKLDDAKKALVKKGAMIGLPVIALILVLIIVFGAVLPNTGYKGTIKKYLNTIEDMDVDKYMEYCNSYDFDGDYYDDDYVEEYLENTIEDLEYTYGEKIKLSFKIEDCDKLTEDRLEAIQDLYDDSADCDNMEIEKGYDITGTLTIKGKDMDRDVEDIGFVLIKEDGKWKVWSGFGTPDYY